jgi:hypothetical protein
MLLTAVLGNEGKEFLGELIFRRYEVVIGQGAGGDCDNFVPSGRLIDQDRVMWD